MELNIDRAEAQINRLIERHHDPRDGEALQEPAYAASVKAYNLSRARERRAAWADHHRRMVGIHEDLAERHRTELLKLIDQPTGGRASVRRAM